ncbi:MAG: hypothetical protein AB7J32_07190 [Pseudonocardia sp.]
MTLRCTVLAGPVTRATLHRAAGGVRAPATEILDRARLDPLLGAAPMDAPFVTLPEAVALARRDTPATAPVRAAIRRVDAAPRARQAPVRRRPHRAVVSLRPRPEPRSTNQGVNR